MPNDKIYSKTFFALVGFITSKKWEERKPNEYRK